MSEKRHEGYKASKIHKCAYPAPYPEVRVVGRNPHYAKLLMEDYAGKVSELSAINQYIYHHLVLEPEYKEVADLLSCVAIVEMHHLEILGETILLLGERPRYKTTDRNERERYWDASFVFYGTALCDMLAADIAAEWAAVANYRRHQQMINDPFVKQILERIILDELHHIRLFHQAAERYCKLNMKME